MPRRPIQSRQQPASSPIRRRRPTWGLHPDEKPAEPVEAQVTLPDLTGKTVYVLDSHSLIFQVFHALPEMTSPRGEPTGAIFGFARDMMFLLDEKKPDYLLAAFDLSGPTFRHELFTAYKEQRIRNARAIWCRKFPTFGECWRRWEFRFWSARASKPTTFWPPWREWSNRPAGIACW